MAYSIVHDAGRMIIRGGSSTWTEMTPRVTSPTPEPEPKISDPTVPVVSPGGPVPSRPIIIIDPGDLANAMILVFTLNDANAASFARLALAPEMAVGKPLLRKATTRIVSHVVKSLLAGGSGIQPLELEWAYKNEISLTDLADALSAKAGSPVTIELPGVASTTGVL